MTLCFVFNFVNFLCRHKKGEERIWKANHFAANKLWAHSSCWIWCNHWRVHCKSQRFVLVYLNKNSEFVFERGFLFFLKMSLYDLLLEIATQKMPPNFSNLTPISVIFSELQLTFLAIVIWSLVNIYY